LDFAPKIELCDRTTFTVFLVNAAHVKNVPGRKTDKADAR